MVQSPAEASATAPAPSTLMSWVVRRCLPKSPAISARPGCFGTMPARNSRTSPATGTARSKKELPRWAKNNNIDFRPFTFHSLRHWHAIAFLRERVGTLHELQLRLGHLSIKTTERYINSGLLSAEEVHCAIYGQRAHPMPVEPSPREAAASGTTFWGAPRCPDAARPATGVRCALALGPAFDHLWESRWPPFWPPWQKTESPSEG